MKTNATILILLALVSSYSLYRATISSDANTLSELTKFTDSDLKIFQEFMETYKKVYSNPQEMLFRLKTVLRAKKIVDKLNSRGSDAKFGLTSVADQTPEEFIAATKKFAPVVKDVQEPSEHVYSPPQVNGSNPDVVDWTKKAPKTQILMTFPASSMATAYVSAMQINHMIVNKSTKKPHPLSSQWIMDCSVTSGSYPSSNNPGDYNSGFLYKYLSNVNIPYDQKQYTMYDSGVSGPCQKREIDMTVSVPGDKPVLVGKTVAAQSDFSLENLVAKGATVVSLTVGSEGLQYYQSGIMDSVSCISGTYQQKWVVPITGYNKSGTESSHYWITRWSINYGWGQNGTMKIRKYTGFTPMGQDYGACGIYRDGVFLKLQDYDED